MKDVLKLLGGITLICGVVWSIFNAFWAGSWIILFFWLVLTAVVSFLLIGLGEVLEWLEFQSNQTQQLQEQLDKLLQSSDTFPEEPKVQLCKKCGTQLPPGGKTCPTCHHVNS